MLFEMYIDCFFFSIIQNVHVCTTNLIFNVLVQSPSLELALTSIRSQVSSTKQERKKAASAPNQRKSQFTHCSVRKLKLALIWQKLRDYN